jgi:HlyD family secretion protein
MANLLARLNSTAATLTAFGMLAIAISLLLNWGPPTSNAPPAYAATGETPVTSRPQWAASATGRVEPKDGEVRITTQTGGEIVAVHVKTNDKVSAGDVMVQLDDTDLVDKLAAARAEAQVRVRERDEEPAAKGPAEDRRRAEDQLDAAERALFDARQALDAAMLKARGEQSAADAATKSRDAVKAATDKVAEERANVAKVGAVTGMPLPTRLEAALSQARSDLTLLENAIDRTRIRAPYDGTVLTVWAKVGETAAPSPDAPLVLFGDLSSLRVRAEVEERDTVKIKSGQQAIIKVDAYGDKEFAGTVTSIAQSLGPPRIASRGPRRPNDVEVLEVLVSLDGNPPLLTGMRVDVFFKEGADSGEPKTN